MRALFLATTALAFAPPRRVAPRVQTAPPLMSLRDGLQDAATPRGVGAAARWLRRRAPSARRVAAVAAGAATPLLVGLKRAVASEVMEAVPEAVVHRTAATIREQATNKMAELIVNEKVTYGSTIALVWFLQNRQSARHVKEVKRIKKAHTKILEEEEEYMKVAGKAESDADIMASLRNRTEAMEGEEDDEDDEGGPAPEAAAPPPPPPPKKRMTMAEKIRAKEAEMERKRKEEGK